MLTEWWRVENTRYVSSLRFSKMEKSPNDHRVSSPTPRSKFKTRGDSRIARRADAPTARVAGRRAARRARRHGLGRLRRRRRPRPLGPDRHPTNIRHKAEMSLAKGLSPEVSQCISQTHGAALRRCPDTTRDRRGRKTTASYHTHAQRSTTFGHLSYSAQNRAGTPGRHRRCLAGNFRGF